MRGIELPAGTEDLKNSGGFYIANKAVFTTDNPARDWDMFTAFLSVQVKKALSLSAALPHYEDTKSGRKAYVFAENDRMKLIVDGQTEYTAVFLTAAGFMPDSGAEAWDARPVNLIVSPFEAHWTVPSLIATLPSGKPFQLWKANIRSICSPIIICAHSCAPAPFSSACWNMK